MSYNPYTLEGKTILVTGASSGIGRAIAIECSKLGARIVITARNEERLRETFSCLQKQENNRFILAELTSEDDLDRLASEVPQIDGLVNAAGIGSTLLFQFAKPDKIHQVFEANFFAPVELTRLLLKKKKINKNGSIVFLSSVDGPITSHVGNSAYSATKGAITAIAKGLAVEMASKGIRVNYLMPGVIETPLISHGKITEEQFKEDMKNYPLGRYGKPEEVAYAAIYFLSDASSFTTGSGLVIDGGFTLL